MESNDISTTNKLLRVFMQFTRAEWHQRSIGGYKHSEIKVLFCIKKRVMPDHTMINVSEISKLLQVTSPTVTQLINGLETKGLVERHIDPTDRRAVCLKLTAKGEIVTSKAEAAFSSTFRGLIEYLGEEQSNQLAELLSKALLYFNEKEANSVHQTSWNGDENA